MLDKPGTCVCVCVLMPCASLYDTRDATIHMLKLAERRLDTREHQTMNICTKPNQSLPEAFARHSPDLPQASPSYPKHSPSLPQNCARRGTSALACEFLSRVLAFSEETNGLPSSQRLFLRKLMGREISSHLPKDFF